MLLQEFEPWKVGREEHGEGERISWSVNVGDWNGSFAAYRNTLMVATTG